MEKEKRETVLYLFFGVCTTVINTSVYILLYKFGGLNNICSNIVAWISAVLFAFFTNKIFVFQSRGVSKIRFFYELISFFSCRIATGIVDIIIMYIGVNLLSVSGIIMKLFSNITVIILNYVASKLFIFHK